MRGVNIPYTGYDGRMKKRVKDARKLSDKFGEGDINREYFYPRRLFKEIEREYRRKSLILKEKPNTPGMIDRGLDAVGDLFGGVEQRQPVASIQTPPLPNTPMPNIQPIAQQINPTTNLTRTEQALLSPEEQVIASRT